MALPAPTVDYVWSTKVDSNISGEGGTRCSFTMGRDGEGHGSSNGSLVDTYGQICATMLLLLCRKTTVPKSLGTGQPIAGTWNVNDIKNKRSAS
jgi:hypothetical protein